MSSLKKKNTFNSDSETHSNDDFELVKSTRANGTLNFNIPKSLDERLKKFDNDTKITNISVEESGKKKNITTEELRDYISNNKKINKITIEEVKANDVKRMDLHFDQEKAQRKSGVHKDFSIIDFEKEVNTHFLNTYKKEKLKNEFKEVVALLNDDRLKLKKKPNLVEEFDELRNFSKVYHKPRKRINETNKEEFVRPEAVSLSIVDSDKENDKESQINKSVNVDISKHELRRKNNKSLSKLYYRAVNHIELFKLGDTYLQDYNRGVKSIAFNSNESALEREKTVLGISSFLNYNARVTVTVVTDNFEQSIYKDLLPDLEVVTKNSGHGDITYSCLATAGIEIVDYSELWNAFAEVADGHIEEFIEAFTKMADVILWDLPFLSKMNDKKELFFPIIRYLDNVSFIVKSNVSKYGELDALKEYFDKYQVPIKGLVLAE